MDIGVALANKDKKIEGLKGRQENYRQERNKLGEEKLLLTENISQKKNEIAQVSKHNRSLEKEKQLTFKELVNNMFIIILLLIGSMATQAYWVLLLGVVYTLVKCPIYIKSFINSRKYNLDELREEQAKLSEEIIDLMQKEEVMDKRLVFLDYRIDEIAKEIELITDIKNYLLESYGCEKKEEDLKRVRKL